MFCRYCGTELPEDTQICPSCGKDNSPAKETSKEKSSAKTKKTRLKFLGIEDKTGGFTKNDRESNRGLALLSYIPLLFLVPMLAGKESPYARFHASQGLLMFIIGLIIWAIKGVFYFLWLIPVLRIILSVIYSILSIVWLLLTLYLLVTTSQAKAMKLPGIGGVELFG
ncbi:MAG: zinc ribbon domain-containing protein [Eubacteriales bacterium]|nr:zinc ribbon domain-containing protein [Eubacteriales bacterium]